MWAGCWGCWSGGRWVLITDTTSHSVHRSMSTFPCNGNYIAARVNA
jgi:hypothetical protein